MVIVNRYSRARPKRREGRRSLSGRSPRRGPSVLTVLGVLLLVTGLVWAGWIGYQFVGTNIEAQQAYEEGKSELRRKWENPPRQTKKKDSAESGVEKLTEGSAFALMRIPRIGLIDVPIRSGVDSDTLAKGIGHFPKSALPGEVGNFAVAGHRITHGEPFSRLLELKPGDEVLVETVDRIFTYRIYAAPSERTVADTETWVVDPNPRDPGKPPTEKLLSLITCEDLFRSPDRSVGFAKLISEVAK